jgi:uncharacterized OB-fold protein
MSDAVQPPSQTKYLLREMNAESREFYRRLAEDRELASTRCGRCERTTFPPRARCPSCGDLTSWVQVPMRGQLYAFTTQETALRFGAPAVLALAELGEVTVPGIVRGDYQELEIGQPVSVHPFAEPETGLTLLEFVPGSEGSR